MNNSTALCLVPAYQKINNTALNGFGENFAVEFLARWVANGKTIAPANFGEVDWAGTDLQLITTLFHQFNFDVAQFELMFINVSDETLSNDLSFKSWLSMLMRLRETSGKKIILEITEQVTPDNLLRRWETLKNHCFDMALDDFGAHFSTLHRLHRHEWSYCKFDESQRFTEETNTAIEYCKAQGISMIAECIEDKLMQTIARGRGLINHQGYFYHKPELMRFSKDVEVCHVYTFC